MAGYLALGNPIVAVGLRRGALTAESAAHTGRILMAFAAGLPGFSTYLYTLRGFYAFGDTRTPFRINCVENAIAVALSFPLAAHYGVVGLAAAQSIAYSISAVIALRSLRRRTGRLLSYVTVRTLVRITVATIVMAAAVVLVRNVIGANRPVLEVLVGVPVGLLVYAGCTLRMRVPEAREIRRRVLVRTSR
jgi:putative peptidoglycan lipid II flippase